MPGKLGAVVLALLVAMSCTTVKSSCELTCENGGICSPQTDTCVCVAGFEGDVCEIEIDECAANPCQNGGACTDGVGEFTCACEAGFAGRACEIDLDECAGDPCLNGGTCIDGANSFTCSCAEGFAGTHCQTCATTVAQNKDFTTQGSFVVAKLGQGQFEITGSANINVLNFNGLGVIGGNSDNTLDGAESLTFTFVHPVSALVYGVQFGSDLNANGTQGDATLEAFDENGLSLGTMPVSGTNTTHDVSALYNNVLISKLIVQAVVDTQRIETMTFNSCP